MLETISNNFYSIIDPPNKDEILLNAEISKLTEDQEFSWADYCSIKVERLDLQEKFFPLFAPSLNIFFNELNLDANNLGIYCDEIWRNTYTRNFYQEIHNHSPLHLSGVLFLNDEQEGDGRFFFFNRDYSEVSKEWRHIGLLSDRKYIKAERGKILLFPSYMLHGVTIHKSDNIRKTLAFNLLFSTV